MKSETIFEDTYMLMLSDIRKRGMATPEDILKLLDTMREYEMDGHCVIAGQNGVGKSYLQNMLLKKALGKNWMDRLIMAKSTTNDLIQYILSNENTYCGIDELSQYLDYKKFADEEQVHLIKMLELARSRRLAFIGCVRDPRKVTYNYRNGKMSIVLWIIDRYKAGGSYAAVFVANPAIESEDKFGFSLVAGDIPTFTEVREIFEDLPSFVGYMAIPHATKLLTTEELEKYKNSKVLSNAYAHLNHCVARYHKKKMSAFELTGQIKMLRGKLPDDVLDNAIPNKKQSKLFDMED